MCECAYILWKKKVNASNSHIYIKIDDDANISIYNLTNTEKIFIYSFAKRSHYQRKKERLEYEWNLK